MYKLFKLFRGKATWMKKEWDLGQQLWRDAAQEEEEVFAPLKMAETVQKQIVEFKVHVYTHLNCTLCQSAFQLYPLDLYLVFLIVL